MVLEFGLLKSELFLSSNALGEGIASSKENVVYRDVGAGNVLVESVELGTAGTTFTFSNLEMADTDHQYVLACFLKNNTAQFSNVSLFVNGDTTATNYYDEYLLASAGVVSAGRQNAANIMTVAASKETCGRIWLDLVKPLQIVKAHSLVEYDSGASLRLDNFAWRKNAATSTLTSISIVAQRDMAVGSRVDLYKVTRDVE